MCIQVQQITYIHPDKEVLFRNLSFTVGKGRQLALIGNNGCGKSTLLQIMAGKLQPSSGNVLRPDDLYYVPQHFGQYDEMSIAQALGIDRKQKALHEILNGNASIDHFNILDDDWNIEEKALAALNGWGLGNRAPFRIHAHTERWRKDAGLPGWPGTARAFRRIDGRTDQSP